MPDGRGDPRVYFAAERTLLAWVRTGIGVMAFGFVVARFGLFVRLLGGGGEAGEHAIASGLGAALVGLGVLTTVAGAVEFRRFYRRLAPDELPSARAPLLGLALAWALAGLGGALAVTLIG